MDLLVLLVSDNEETFLDLLRHIEEFGHKGRLVSSDHLSILQGEFDLVLLDGELLEAKPDILIECKKRRKWSRRPITAVASSLQLENVANWLEQGVDDWLLYPSHPLVLKAKIDQFVRVETLTFIAESVSALASESRPSITTIIGYADMIELKFFTVDDEQHRPLFYIKQGATRINSLLTDYSNFVSAAVFLSTYPDKKRIPIDSDLELKLLQSASFIEKISPSLTFEIADNLPAVLADDEYHLHDIFLNLIKIASYCAVEDTKIVISAQLDTTLNKTKAEHHNVHFVVQYMGTVIDNRDIDRIFGLWSDYLYHKYQRLKVIDSDFKLAIAKATVEAFGGKIWLENTPDGNAFHFTLPAA